MRNPFLNCLLGLLCMLLVQPAAFGQIYQVNSPYSYHGWGTMAPTQQAFNRSMAGISEGLRSPVHLNVENPASYSSLRFSTFETAVHGQGLWLSDLDSTYRSGSASISYINLGFPAGKHAGLSFGLMPFSDISYDVLDTRYNEGLQADEQFQFLGTGEVYRTYVGAAGRYKGFALGFNFNYLFGTYNRRAISFFEDNLVDFGSRHSEIYVIGDIMWDFGAQYGFKVKERTYLTAGISGRGNSDIKTTRDKYFFRRQDNGFPIDTISRELGTEGSMVLPAQLGIGINYERRNYWLVGIDVQTTSWDQFELFGQKDVTLKSNTRISIGGNVTPDPLAIKGLAKKINYRFGAYYDTGHLEINNQRINEFGLSFGLGIPMRPVARTALYSRLNLSFEIGQRGTSKDELIRESFFRTTMGVNFNDLWFIKRKFD